MWKHWNGAESLWKNEDEWSRSPEKASEVLLDSDEGVKRAKITVGAAVVQKNFWCFLFQRYPKWDRLRRLVAWLIRVFTQAYTSKITGWTKHKFKYRVEAQSHPFFSARSDWSREEDCEGCTETFISYRHWQVSDNRSTRLTKPFEEEGILCMSDEDWSIQIYGMILSNRWYYQENSQLLSW